MRFVATHGACRKQGDVAKSLSALWVARKLAQGKVDNASLPALEAKMTPQQIAEAQQQANAFRPRKESYLTGKRPEQAAQ